MESGDGNRWSARLSSGSDIDVRQESKENLGKRDQNDIGDEPTNILKFTKMTKKQIQDKKLVSNDAAEKEQKRMDCTNALHSEGKLNEDENGETSDLLTNTESPNSAEQSSRGNAKKAAPKVRKSTPLTNSAPKEPKKRKTKFQIINDQLEALGFHHDDEHGNCARAAIYRGFIKLTGKPSDLDQVVFSDTLMCGHKCDAKLGDLLRQPDYGGDDYEDGLQFATVICEECAQDSDDDEYVDDLGESRTYVTRICQGNPTFNCGKFHNHCNDCMLFGECIGDYRERHCHGCGGHYFAGSGGQFPCPRCDGSDSDLEERDDCVLM